LREVAENLGVPAYMVDHADEIQPEWFLGKRVVGVTAGASAPEILVQRLIDRLRGLGIETTRLLIGVKERVNFPLPRGLDTSIEG
jgi:4-hydroxy-3-methylbut-2-enyl diphosphate reductase